MAVLSEADRVQLNAELMRELSAVFQTISGLNKADLRAAIDAADAWADTNATSFNLALPLAARNNLTARQKALALLYVIRQRYVRA